MGLCTLTLPEKIGLSRGFRAYERTQKLTARATKFLSRAKEPFFLWLHYAYPHDPYSRHARWDFGDAPLDRYDSEVAYTDHEIGRLLDELGRSGRAERTLVVVTADHGEEFGEHGGYFHGHTVYRELLHVPLVAKVPGGPSGVVEDVVELVDVVPTIAEAVGLPNACAEFDGRSLLRERSALAPRMGEGAYSENFLRHGVQHRALSGDSWKIIEDFALDRVELYDTRSDPSEQKDLSEKQKDVAARLRDELAVWSHRSAPRAWFAH